MAATKRRKGDATQPERERVNRSRGVRLAPDGWAAVDELAATHRLSASAVLTLALAVSRRYGALDAACAEARRWADALERPKDGPK